MSYPYLEYVEHLPGPVVALRQECARCHCVLEDYQGRTPMVPVGMDTTIPFWTEGEPVAVAPQGGVAFTVSEGVYPRCQEVS